MHALKDESWELCSDHLFALLFGLPAKIQLGLAIFVLIRYLDIFETKYPKLQWPRIMTNDLDTYVGIHGSKIQREPANMSASDSAFTFGLTAVAIGGSNRDSPLVLTSSCVCAVVSSINSRMTNVWIADDPIAYQMWQRSELVDTSRTVLTNVAAKAVGGREWSCIVEWVNAREIWPLPDEIDPKEISASVQLWKEKGRLILTPEKIKGQTSKKQKAEE